MAQGRSDFRELERTNRRETVELVVVFLVLFCALGFGLDFVIGTVRIIDGRLIGFPVLTIAALVIGSIQALASFYGGAGMVLASVHARPLMPDSPKHQMVIDVVQAMAVLVLAVLAPIFSQLIAMAVSRQREYLADVASAEFTRNPRAVLRALERIAQTESPLK